MTIQELKDHCEKQVNQCELFAKHRDEEPSGKIYEEHKLILELIEQVQFMNKPCMSAGVCEHDKMQILDKIRAEIQRLRGCSCSCSDGIIDDVEDIIEKYKSESEVEE